MASFLMDWTPTNAAVIQNTSSRGIKRAFGDFSLPPASPQSFNPYAVQYMPGGWPASPRPDQLSHRAGGPLMSGALDATGTPRHEDRIIAAEAAETAGPENATSPQPQNIIFQAIKRLCLGIASQFSTRGTKPVYPTRLKPKLDRSSKTPSCSPKNESYSRTPQSSAFSTILHSHIPSTPNLSGVEKELDDAHMPNANEKSITQLGLAKTVAPPNSAGKGLDSPYLRCANPKLRRKLGLMQSPTPPESPRYAATNEVPNELFEEAASASPASPPNKPVDKAKDTSPTASLTPPATPLAERGVYNFFEPAAEVMLKSPFPKLIPSLSLRSQFKFGETPLNEPHNVFVPARTPEQPLRPRFEFAVRTRGNTTSSTTNGVRITPSAQLFAEIARDHSRVVGVSTPDPYPAKSPLSPPMSGELSAEQQKRYSTRARVKQQEEAAKQSKGYNIEPLSKEWEAKVEHALKYGHGPYTAHDLIKVVPPNASKTTSQWLNDETINGYLKLVTELGNKGQNTGATPMYFAFTSFFMTALLEKGYEGIKRWSKRAKIDGKKLYDVQEVFIPVNRSLHWTVLVVSPKNKTIRYYDSLGGSGRSFVAAALQWLRGELGASFVEGDWMIDNAAPSPLQNNGSDCGVFAVTTAKHLMLGRSPMGYGAVDIPTQRRRIVAELIAGKLL